MYVPSKQRMRCALVGTVGIVAAILVFASVAGTETTTEGAADTASAEGKIYDEHVKCEDAGGQKDCKIDLFLTRGFRAFSQCQVCHGLDANGSTIAPSLVEKLQQIDKARFVDVVTNGFTGQIGVMPGWKSNPNVMKYVDNLYTYLVARSDKVIPPGKLKRYDR